MKHILTLGSLFDGSGGFPLAGLLNGITPIWASEIEPYPIRVTKEHFPQVKHYGDVSKINGAEIDPVDIITFGSPCQDLSIAGEQLGIHEGQRSNLFFEAARIIKEMRESDERTGRADEHIRPRFAVWENVPGAFSSNKGADFQAVLQALASVRENGVSIPQPKKWGGAGCVVGNGWSIAWRVYDAQYWGVPQRRKRIYLIADFASERAGEILFERESMCGDSAPCGEAREGTAADAERGVERSGGTGIAAFMGSWQNVVALDCRNLVGNDNLSATLQAKANGGQSLNYINPVVYDARGNGDGNTSPTLTGDHENRVTDYTAVCVGNGQLHQMDLGDKSGALNCMHDQQAVVYPGVGITSLQNVSNPQFGDPAPSLTNDSRNYAVYKGKPPRKYIIRRLTPLECNRLQGFPDNWGAVSDYTEISDEDFSFWENVRKTVAEISGKEYKPKKSKKAMLTWLNKLHNDSSEYKMWGNGIALPCAVDVLGRIAQYVGGGNDENSDENKCAQQ